MQVNGKRFRLTALVLLVIGLVLTVTVNFTDACRLRAVTLDGKPVENWQAKFSMLRSAPLSSQPVDRLAKQLLADADVFKVDVTFKLPGEIDIRTNEFEPVCFVLGQETGKLFGLNSRARLIALDYERIVWEQPVFTGLVTGALHSFCKDPRVVLVLDQLEELRHARADLYRLVDEIDFSEKDFLTVAIAGLPYRLTARADRLNEDFDRFVEFTRNYQTNLTGVERVDLRYDEMIICALSKEEMKRREEEAKEKAKLAADSLKAMD